MTGQTTEMKKKNNAFSGLLFTALVCCFFLHAPAHAVKKADPRKDGLETAPKYQPGELISLLETHAKKIRSLRCDFTQEKIHPMFNRPLEFRGVIAFRRPDSLRWEYTAPLPSVIIIKDKRGKRCAGTGEAYEFSMDNDPVMAKFSSSLKRWLTGDYSALADIFEISRPSEWSLFLRPKPDGNGMPAGFTILVNIDPRTVAPSSLTIKGQNPAGIDTTTIRFESCLENPDIPETEFASCH